MAPLAVTPAVPEWFSLSIPTRNAATSTAGKLSRTPAPTHTLHNRRDPGSPRGIGSVMLAQRPHTCARRQERNKSTRQRAATPWAEADQLRRPLAPSETSRGHDGSTSARVCTASFPRGRRLWRPPCDKRPCAAKTWPGVRPQAGLHVALSEASHRPALDHGRAHQSAMRARRLGST